MSELSTAGFPYGEPASVRPLALPPLETQRTLQEQREVYAALDSLETMARVGAPLMNASTTGVVFSDEIGGPQTTQSVF
jgi:hypothetical protein